MHASLLSELLSDTRPVVERLLVEPPLPAEALLASLDAFDVHLKEASENPLVDEETGAALSSACRTLIARTRHDPSRLRLTQVAVRYLVMEDDGDRDTESPFGFDDDVEVFNAVCGALELPDLLLDIRSDSFSS